MSLIRVIVTSIFLFCTSIYVTSQSINHWESVVLSDHSSRYFSGVSAPDANWKLLSYDDAEWEDGQSSVGYGDEDDLTVIDPVLAVYLRVTFDIIDSASIADIILHMDYDDAFVAYLNGTEIARSNIGETGTEPLFTEPALSNHEALLYAGGVPEVFIVTNDVVASTLQQGANVLAIQVHNVEANSSDMTCMPFLSLGITDESKNYSDTPSWFVAPPEAFSNSHLPILIFDTEGGANIQDDPKVNANLKIAYNETGELNYVDGPFHSSSGLVGIEIRGNATQMFPKKAYIFETRDSLGDNRNVKILGMPAENDWILRACYLDKTLMRNAIAFEMSRSMGRYASRYAFCEVIINGSYEGVYMLMEKIKRDKNRVDVEKLNNAITDSDSIKGGYIYEVSQSTSDLGERRSLVYPNPEDANDEQFNYIINYDDQFRAIMEQPSYADPKSGYPMWIDVQSFIDEILVQEACKNCDAYGWSSYFHKKRHQKLAAGPVWDFDQALSNSTWNDGSNANEWVLTKINESVPTFWAKLFNEPNFKYLLKKRWFALRENSFHTDTLMAMIDGYAQQLDGAQQRNFYRWPILGSQLWRSLPGWEERDTYKKEVDYMKEWFKSRLIWMDEQLVAVPDQIINVPDLVISEIMYSAYHGAEHEYLKIENAGTVAIDLTGVFFSDGIEYAFNTGETILAGEHVVIASDTIVFRGRYGTAAYASFFGQLDNKGENIEMQNSLGVTIDKVNYSDTLPWPVSDMYHTGAIELLDVALDNEIGTNWAFAETPDVVPNLVISEIMYAPEDGAAYEFIEVINADADTLDLSGVYLSDAIDYAFPEGYKLPAGKSVVLAADTLLFEMKYGFAALGEFSGKLNNSGEEIVMQTTQGVIIDIVNYNDTLPWPVVNAENAGSIELVDNYADNALPENWQLSETALGTPIQYAPTTSMALKQLEHTLQAYPNPAIDIVSIDISHVNGQSVQVEILDMMGVAHMAQTYGTSQFGLISINVSRLIEGSYLLKISSQDAVMVDKLTIKR